MAALLLLFLLSAAPSPARAQDKHCGIALLRPDIPAASPGDILELTGYWGESQGDKTPFLLSKETNILPVVSWSPGTIKVQVPPTLQPGRYKLGVYCDKPGRGLGFATAWYDFELAEKGGAALKPGPVVKPRRQAGSLPNLSLWLTMHPKLREALNWEGKNGAENYFKWPWDRKAKLDRYFQMAWNGEAYGLPDPPANLKAQVDGQTVQQLLSGVDALNLYLATAAQSLALEAGRHLPWQLEDSAPADIAVILDSREMFTRWEDGRYMVYGHRTGFVLPPPPDAGYAFMQDKIGRDRFGTIVSVLDWAGRNLIHFEGEITAKNMEAQWQYRGLPPATRMIKGTYYSREGGGVSFSRRTAGCTGTSGFLRAVLRCVNIPVRLVEACGHITVYFPTEKRYLSHGDDPYSRTDGWGTPCAAAKLLIDEATFNSWLGKQVPRAECAKNVGRGAREILSRPCPGNY